MQNKIPLTTYQHQDVVYLAKHLIGKILWTNINDELTAGRIVETEAYSHMEKACHAHQNRRTRRTETLFAEGGTAYIYLCYGIHHLFNVVTNSADTAEAVLIRAIEPVFGQDVMEKRRNMVKLSQLTSGPGKLSRALGIHTGLDGISLTGDTIWITNDEKSVANQHIASGPRIGVDYAGEDALLPWRFILKNNSFISVPFSK